MGPAKAADPRCPDWCTEHHEPLPRDCGEWVMTHRSDRTSFEVTHGETAALDVPKPADVHTSSLTTGTASAEPRRITLTLPTDCWQEAWLSADQAERLGRRLVGLVDVLRADARQ